MQGPRSTILSGGGLKRECVIVSQAVLDTVLVTFFDQSYVTSVEAMADNFVVGL